MAGAIALFASARRNGNTGKLIGHIAAQLAIEVIDLGRFRMAPYDYEHRNRGDDFEPLMLRGRNRGNARVSRESQRSSSTSIRGRGSRSFIASARCGLAKRASSSRSQRPIATRPTSPLASRSSG